MGLYCICRQAFISNFRIKKKYVSEFPLTLDPLIESYLDIFEVYMTMFIEWKEKGFPPTQRHTNKAGATNNSKHPLAQQVETWADKKTKALDLLGLTNKAKPVTYLPGLALLVSPNK
ncbi:P27 family phage terminase small subunit, partial [Bacillus sp. HC-Mk]